MNAATVGNFVRFGNNCYMCTKNPTLPQLLIKLRDQGDFIVDKTTFQPITEYWKEVGVN